MDASPPTIGPGPRVYFTPYQSAKVRRKTHQPPAIPKLVIPEAHDEALALMAILFRKAGLESAHYRPNSLRRRLPACLRALGAAGLDEAWNALARGASRLPAALDSVLLGVTDFFRDSSVFDQLEHEILPEICALTHVPRMWSAACSSGQELYSVALMLEAAGKLDQAELWGTDCREEALREAARGHYPIKPGRAADPGVARRFGPVPIIRIPESVRRHLHWKCADLFHRREPGPWDLILWRNMAIYLNAEAARVLWQGLFENLRPGGFLVTGRTETPPPDLRLIRRGPCIYQKPSTEIPRHAC